jgi:diadenosine tetraphosphatase ApaH/serine/threonine PP2A family protein phosphatase
MYTAILSDIHANLEALDAICRVCDERRVDSWVCLGDIVGYGADPGPCLERTRALTDQVVLGNHDAAATDLLDLTYFNDYARAAALWTADQLDQDEKSYLANLPLFREHEDAFYVHAEPRDPGSWGYVHSRSDARAALGAVPTQFCFIGHSHQPFMCVQNGTEIEPIIAAGPVEIEADQRYLVNIGSVGQPRDGDARSCFLIWSQASGTLELIRVEYDIPAAQKKIIAAGLPPFLAQRLALGH